MGLIDYDADDVVEMIEMWRPEALDNEVAYEDALYTYLSGRLKKGHAARRQFWAANSRTDIMIDFGDDNPKVAIELKANLTDRNEYHRVLGQMWTYSTDCECDAVLVLCGKCDPALVKLAQEYVEFLNDNLPLERKVKMAIIPASQAQAA